MCLSRPQRDSWDSSVPEPVSQVEALCGDSLASVSVAPSLPSPEPPGSPSQYRPGSGRGGGGSSALGSVSGGQPYTLHPLEDAHYHPLTPSASSYPASSSAASFSCPAYMSGPAPGAAAATADLVSKMVTEEADALPPPPDGPGSWVKEDGVNSWSPYELRRAY